MDKLSKIFLSIIIILVIALIFSIYLYFQSVNETQIVKGQLYEVDDFFCGVMKAVEDKGLRSLRQEDGTFVLVEREGEIEETID